MSVRGVFKHVENSRFDLSQEFLVREVEQVLATFSVPRVFVV